MFDSKPNITFCFKIEIKITLKANKFNEGTIYLETSAIP